MKHHFFAALSVSVSQRFRVWSRTLYHYHISRMPKLGFVISMNASLVVREPVVWIPGIPLYIKGLVLRGIPRIPKHQSKPPFYHYSSCSFCAHIPLFSPKCNFSSQTRIFELPQSENVPQLPWIGSPRKKWRQRRRLRGERLLRVHRICWVGPRTDPIDLEKFCCSQKIRWTKTRMIFFSSFYWRGNTTKFKRKATNKKHKKIVRRDVNGE